MNFINFNEHIVKELLNEYGGSERKKTVVLDNGKKYLLKFPDPTREQHRKISYINNSLSEYIGCQIFASVGIPVQDTILGVYMTEAKTPKIACACEDLQAQGGRLYEADKIALTSLDTGGLLTFDSIQSLIGTVEGMDVEATYAKLCDRFIIDALIGNTDRHNGNWGFLKTGNTEICLAPVYDCGSSMSPMLGDEELTEKAAVNEAANTASAIMDETGKRLHYREFLLGNAAGDTIGNTDIKMALCRMVPKINMSKIEGIIEEIPYLSDTRKWFYKRLLYERYEKILLPALKKSLGIHKTEEDRKWNSNIIASIYECFMQPLLKLDDSANAIWQMQDKQITGIKAGNQFFVMDHGCCTGYIDLQKTNQNVALFVLFARQMGINIDAYIDALKDGPVLDMDWDYER